MADSNFNYKGHVFYFEPNDLDLGRDQNGDDVSLTPHFEDMSISMSLIADIFPRNKSCIGKGDADGNLERCQRSISWISYGGDSTQVMSGGTKMNGEKYLTTYYTEISADKYIENELVEGLGVTNVTISFESWYTPTITINFVDVHGSALWGREEAIYSNGEITASNVLGVFFTLPYPLFRLQVKGFLGEAVTYQLSVSSFKGKYNSQTGNFEATATFIGYSYSLLTDIPLSCISYISDIDYVGRDYWQAHKQDADWQLYNADGTTREPVPLYQVITSIRSAIGYFDKLLQENCENEPTGTVGYNEEGSSSVESGQNVSLSTASDATNGTVGNVQVIELRNCFNDFLEECKKWAAKVYIGRSTTNHHSELLLTFDKGKCNAKNQVSVPKGVTDAYQKFINNFEAYKKDGGNIRYSLDGLNPSFHKALVEGNRVCLTDKIGEAKIDNNFYKPYDVSPDYIFNKRRESVNYGFYKNVQPIINENSIVSSHKLFPNTIEQYEKDCNEYNEYNKNNAGFGNRKEGYNPGDRGLALILGDLVYDLFENEKLSAVNPNSVQNYINGYENLRQDILDKGMEKLKNMKIVEFIGFEPTIGNFTKLMMCHLETFIEVMMVCGEQIYKNKESRTPKNLGIPSLSQTDIPATKSEPLGTSTKESKWIYPWPALYNHRYKTNSETPGDENENLGDVLGWPGDFPATNIEWEEQKVVVSLGEAIERYQESLTEGSNIQNGSTYSSVPMVGSDLSTKSSPFDSVASSCKDVGTLSGYLGLRIAQIIGVGDNKCDDTVAKALGSIDALNLIRSYDKIDRLSELITSKDGNRNFANRVIDYITCANSSSTTAVNNDGEGYNVFETMSSGTSHYSVNRHPMFVKNGNNFTYSYSYTLDDNKTATSIIPTKLYPFTAMTNPYADLLKQTVTDGEAHCRPRIVTDNQEWVYTSDSHKLFSEVENEGCNEGDYTNKQLFDVITNSATVDSLTLQIKALKEGSIKLRGYEVKGATDDKNIEMFIKRRYKLDDKDYCKFYFNDKDYHIIGPSITSIDEDYGKNNLCLDISKKDDISFNGNWCNDKTELYRKIGVQKDGMSFKANSKSITNSEMVMMDLPIRINSSLASLFGTKLYYQQKTSYAKAYLILTSMMSGVGNPKTSIFKEENCSIIEKMPPFYVLFIGALLWRASNENGVAFNGFNAPDAKTSLISKKLDIFDIDCNKELNWYTLADYYKEYDGIDIAVRNKLIKIFKNYADGNTFKTIFNNLELKPKNNQLDSSLFNNGNTIDKWREILGSDVFNSYSSVVVTDDSQNLRLLISEKNKAQSELKNLYGIGTPFVVGRGTTKDVGRGNKEVKVTEAQMKGYLSGFEERISKLVKIKDEDDKRTQEASTSLKNRDEIVSMYYSLKHLWDTWLITATRDQFTIKEFFNKYFIFMDSFYMNTYNKIKLNCETIERCYRTDGQNLFSFITNVTSDAGCMFFALPDFIDSNAYGDGTVGNYVRNYNSESFNWRKKDLEKMFMPISHNEMRPPQPNNVFVFIYTHQFSDNALENTDKRFDSYSIKDVNDRPNILESPTVGGIKVGPDNYMDANDQTQEVSPNNRISNETEQLITARYGYMLPCFGVAVNRGNNYIFKAINVDMSSPKVTAISAQTLENIYTKYGADSTKRVNFRGQNIYSVYAQYAYSCEIEMLGCAQMQPLMYFQLLNIPMWRGTYMVYKVTHSMSPGNMTTKFTGMKMSRYQTPFATGYFAVGKDAIRENGATEDYVTQNSNALKELLDNSQAVEDETNPIGGNDMFKIMFGEKYQSQANNGEASDVAVIRTMPNKTVIRSPWNCTIKEVNHNNKTVILTNKSKNEVTLNITGITLNDDISDNKEINVNDSLGIANGDNVKVELFNGDIRINPYIQHS